MTMRLLYKELRLAAHPTLYVFLFAGALLLIPAYPYGIVFFFGCLSPLLTFIYARENNDTYYTALLPIPKNAVVKAKCLLVMAAQIAQIIISIPFAVCSVFIHVNGNSVGLSANITLYGMGLLVFALFNLIFFPIFYKTAHRAGRAFLATMVPVTFGVLLMQALPFFPGLRWVGGISQQDMVKQIPILILGIAVYAVGSYTAYKLAARRFAQVDL